MKTLSSFVLLLLIVTNGFSQSSIDDPFHFTFSNYTQYHPPLGLQVPVGPDYGCAANHTAKTIWFYFETCGKDSGASEAAISPFTSANGHVAVVIWGPFDDTINIVSKLTTANIDTCALLFVPGNLVSLRNLQYPKIYYGMVGLDSASTFSQLGTGGAGLWWFDDRCGLYNGKVTNYKQDICMVTLDSITQKNKIIWEKKDNFGIASFNIYRESTSAGQFDSIGNVLVTADGSYIDNFVNPNQQAYKYRIAGIDSSGNTALIYNSNPADSARVHETIHLQSSIGVNNEVNLHWNAYIGFPYNTFYIYRGDSINNLQLIDSVSATTFSYTDLTPPSGIHYYRITVKNPSGCSPDGGNTIYSQAISNHPLTNIPTGLNNFQNSIRYTLSPNPFKDNFTITFKKNISNGILEIYNTLGKIIFVKEINGSQQIINCSLEKGLYFIQIKEGKNIWMDKAIVDY
jgi:hypothetical protein